MGVHCVRGVWLQRMSSFLSHGNIGMKVASARAVLDRRLWGKCTRRFKGNGNGFDIAKLYRQLRFPGSQDDRFIDIFMPSGMLSFPAIFLSP